MEPLRTIRAFFARLAGAPLVPEDGGRHPPPNLRQRSSLYAPPAPPDIVERRATTRQRDGDEGEAAARRHLERAGLTFVAANVRYRDGEIDLVMRERPTPTRAVPSLVFVEVRRRARAEHGGAAGSITRTKRRRIVAAAAHYLVGLQMRTLPPSRFDVVTIDGCPPNALRIEWHRDAFRDEG